MGKARPVSNPYLVYTNDSGWTWKVLKAYAADPNKPYARWFTAVSSPFTYGGYDMGDTYVADVVGYGHLTYRDPDVPLTAVP